MPRNEFSTADFRADPDTMPAHESAQVGRGGHAQRPASETAGGPGMLSSDALQAWAELRRMRGPGEQRAVVLALLLTPGSARERHAWREETRDVMTAAHVLRQIERLPGAARLPALEALLEQGADLPLAQRQALLQAVRRVMCADGRVRPIDRLALLLTRHRLSGAAPAHRGGARDDNELTGLPLALRQAIAAFTAYLARMVPEADPHAVVGAAGAAWHRAVVQSVWGVAPNPPSCQVPDAAALVRVLHAIQDLGWMRRPVLARLWMDAASDAVTTGASPGSTLGLDGAQALRMACGLLDTPVPPDLAQLFNELPRQA